MSLIPFILELADELHEFNRCLATGSMDIDDFGFGIYPHELQPTQQQQQQSQHPLQQQQQQQQQHLSQQRRPRSLSQFYWMSNLSKSRHHPYYRGKPCCSKTPIHLVHDHRMEKESASNAGGGSGAGVIGTSLTGGTSAGGDKESAANTHAPNSGSSNTLPNTAAGKSAYSVVNKNGFQVSMNVKQFAPNELTVKTIDNCIVVEGQHEDKEDGHGVISRHFIRKYMLPKGYDPNEVLSTLSSDGILTVKAPPPAMKTDESMERIVDIQQTGGPIQVQQSPVKEPLTNSQSSVKEVQTSAASVVEQTVTLAATTIATAPLQTSALQQQQQLQKHQSQQPQESQQLCAAIEAVQQQQSSKVAQPVTVKDLQVTRVRNVNLEPNELVIEQETEPRTAEQAATSSNANNNNNNNNSNNNNNTNREAPNIEYPVDHNDITATTNNANSKTEVKEKKCSIENEELTEGLGNVNNKKPITSNETKSLTIDDIMTAATTEEPMEEKENEQMVTKEKVIENEPIVVEVHIADHDLETSSSSNLNSVGNSSTASDNYTASNNIVVPSSSTANTVETNGIEIIPTNNIDIELTTATIAEASEILVVTKNGVSDDKTVTVTDDGLTITLETTVAEADGVTEMETDVTDMETDGDGIDAGVIAIGVDIGVGVDVNVIAGDGSSSTSVEDGKEESVSVGNLVVAAQSPTAGDLVAAADAAILLAKTQCDGGVADVAAGKPAITTEEITN